MDQIGYNSIKNQPTMFLTDLAEKNYFNPRLQVIRVVSPFDETQFLDFRLAPTHVPPNNKLHRVLLVTAKEQINSIGLSEERLELIPGIEDKNWTPAELQMGVAYLIDRNQRLYTVDNQTGSTGFSIRNTNMFEQNKVKLALSPPIPKDYTNNSNQQNDTNEIGIFMNDDAVIIRSRGAQITLGDEGVHIGGKQHWENTAHSKEIMQDNFIHQLVPSTIPTAGVSIPQLPNFGMIGQIAETCNKVINIVGKTKKITRALDNLA